MSASEQKGVTLSGVGASQGIATARAIVVDRRSITVPQAHIKKSEVPGEISRFSSAIKKSVDELKALEKQVAETFGGEHVEILEAHELMLQDDFLIRGTEDYIRKECINAEWALIKALEEIKEFFNNLEDDFFRERRSDVEFVGDRILRNLTGEHDESLLETVASLKEPSILVAYEFTPAETIQLRDTNVVGLCMADGTKTSHSAIVARSLELVTVVGVTDVFDHLEAGDQMILDGDTGTVCVRPTSSQKAAMTRRHRKVSSVRERLNQKRKLEATSIDGFHVKLTGNIDLLDEVDAVIAHGGHGVGLYRTEFLFLNRSVLPSEDEQFEVYKTLLEEVAPNPVTIRTLDIGGDKLEIPGDAAKKLTPFFGLRAIRYCLKEKHMFMTQLRALLRASVYGRLRILVPFVTDVTEIWQVKDLIAQARSDLMCDGYDVRKDVEVGAMIEIPSAALISEILARHVDFFSVGTNDLIQYTLAIARETTEVGYLYHPLHPAVLRVLKLISDSAHREGIRLSMCGEMASEPLYTPVLLGLRFQELSMSPRSIPVVREIIQRSHLSEVRTLVDGLFHQNTYQDVEAVVTQYMHDKFPDLIPLMRKPEAT